MRRNVELLTSREFERTLSDLLNASARAVHPTFEVSTELREGLVKTLRKFAVEDEAQTGEQGEFWVGEEWQKSNYLPIIANSIKMFEGRRLEAIKQFIAKENSHYCCTVVIPFPKAFWGLQVLVTGTRMCGTALKKAKLAEVREVFEQAGLSELVTG